MKTIDEAAREYANDNMWYPGETSYESDIIEMEKSFADAFEAGATHIMSLPLAERLTPEEREKIKALHDRREQTADLYLEATCINAQESSAIDYCKGYAQALRDIIGKAMFAEEGGCNEKE